MDSLFYKCFSLPHTGDISKSNLKKLEKDDKIFEDCFQILELEFQ